MTAKRNEVKRLEAKKSESKKWTSKMFDLTPVALQYLYGGSTKVQREGEVVEPVDHQHDIEGIVVTESKNEVKPVYPFALYNDLKQAQDAKSQEESPPPPKAKGRQRPRRGVISKNPQEYETFTSKGSDQPEQDLEADEMFRYGTPDPSIPPSYVPCGGCGAHLHCQDSKFPGFVPSEIFSRHHKRDKRLRKIKCQRCNIMAEYNIALKMTISPEDYPKAIGHLKDERKAIILLIVDLVDFPGSVWPNIMDLIGSDKRVILVGNKVDLLPQDCDGYLENIQDSMVRTFLAKCNDSLDRKPILLDSVLVSARTGYNVEQMITLVIKHWREKHEHVGGDVYLVGTTNVGKSSLFNLLLDSDLCKVKALSRIDKATTSPVPGTTLNLLKFPIMRPNPAKLSMRYSRLKNDTRVIKRIENERIANLRKFKSATFATPYHPVGCTFWYKGDQQSFASSVFTMNTRQRLQKSPSPNLSGFDPNENDYKHGKWCFDTPGTVCEDQVLNLLTQEEIMSTLPQLPIMPRAFSLHVGQSLFIGGLARLDVLRGPKDNRWADERLLMAVFASDNLPINIVLTEAADEFYAKALQDGLLHVPSNKNRQRLQDFPKLEGQELEIDGISDSECSCDVVFSSVGWISMATRVTLTYEVKAWTPGGKGVFLRDPPFLPFALNLRGNKIKGTPAFGKSKLYIP